MALSTQQQMLVEQRLSNDKKSTVVAYLLWFFLGGFGGHRFYIGKTGTAITQLLLLIFGFILMVAYVGILLLAALGIWLLVDAFLIPGMIEKSTTSARERIRAEIEATSSAG
jgi:TM2 domain-containing membrane protein YozV